MTSRWISFLLFESKQTTPNIWLIEMTLEFIVPLLFCWVTSLCETVNFPYCSEISKFICRGPNSEPFSVTSTQLCHCSSKAVRHCVNEQVWLRSNKNLFMDSKNWISYNFVSHEIVFIWFFFFQQWKNVKATLSSWAVQKWVVSWIWPINYNLQPFWLVFGYL